MANLANHDCSAQWIDAVRSAIASKQALTLRAGGSKQFLLDEPDAQNPLDLKGHTGIIDYQPSELVITVRSGTPIRALNKLLAEHKQFFPCEPPEFDGVATVGGMVATSWAGPRRPWSGPVRDYVLGCRLISGTGDLLRFGGQVIKNVAGYDVSRLMVGSFGSFGVLTELSLKVLPMPRAAVTQALEIPRNTLAKRFFMWRRTGLALAGLVHDGTQAFVRLEGNPNAVDKARRLIGGDTLANPTIWSEIREHTHAFFSTTGSLWRLSVPTGTILHSLPGTALMDWAGAQWWLKAEASTDYRQIQAIAKNSGGHATCYDRQKTAHRWQALEPGFWKLNAQLKTRLDPHNVFNKSLWTSEPAHAN